jgi:L-2-hydroxyglutarate oxidase LhgO
MADIATDYLIVGAGAAGVAFADALHEIRTLTSSW